MLKSKFSELSKKGLSKDNQSFEIISDPNANNLLAGCSSLVSCGSYIGDPTKCPSFEKCGSFSENY